MVKQEHLDWLEEKIRGTYEELEDLLRDLFYYKSELFQAKKRFKEQSSDKVYK